MLREIFSGDVRSFKTRANAVKKLKDTIWKGFGNNEVNIRYTIIAVETKSSEIRFAPVVHLEQDQMTAMNFFAEQGVCVTKW
jgi:hypothetical protein